jgi:PAP2 superfamily C-terminal
MKKRGKWILVFAIAFLIISLAVQYLTTLNINLYPNPPIANDFFFEHLPFVDILWFADLIVILSSVSFMVFMFTKKRIKEFPFYALVIGTYSLLRSLFIYFTPLGNPHPAPGLGLALVPSGGMFPSGHCGAIFLFFLLAKDKSKYWSIYFIILLVIEIASMLLSRGHYSIDIIGALFIAFAVWKVADEHFRKNLVLR